jgi:uncharacterized protein
MKKFLFLPVILAFSFFSGAAGQEIPDPLVPVRLVNDYTGILKENEFVHLERKLERFNDSTSTQIVIAIVKSLNGYSKEDFADRLGEKWGVGQKGRNNGIVVLVKPKYRDEPGQARISVGYGLESVIPDAVSRRIVGNEMVPYFKEGNYFKGLDQATNTLISLARGEFTADQYQKKTQGSLLGLLIPALIIVVIIIIMSRNSRNHYTAGSKGTSIWTAMWLASMMSNRGHGGSWGNFNSGGGSWGGGGGFGGFGGGSFGGGGAGGSW